MMEGQGQEIPDFLGFTSCVLFTWIFERGLIHTFLKLQEANSYQRGSPLGSARHFYILT